MTGPEAGHDMIVAHVAATLSAARIARAMLHCTVIPGMPPARRTFPQSLARRLERQDIISEDLARDLKTFIEMLERQLVDGIVVGWEADGHSTAGGYEVVYRSDDIAALAGGVRDLEELRDLILRTLDLIRARAIVEDLLAV